MNGLLATKGVMLSASYGANLSPPIHRKTIAMAMRIRCAPNRSERASSWRNFRIWLCMNVLRRSPDPRWWRQMRPRYAGENRLRIRAEEIVAAERNSFADRINEQRPPTDPLSAIAQLLRVRRVEVQDLCRFASAWRSPHTAEAPSWAQFHMVTKGNCFLDLENGETFHLQAGSLLLLPRGDAHIVRSSHGARSRTVPVRVEYNNAIRVKTNTLGSSDTELICGRLQFDAGPSGLIVATLPAAILLHVNSERALGHMRRLVQMIDEELTSARAGGLAGGSGL